MARLHHDRYVGRGDTRDVTRRYTRALSGSTYQRLRVIGRGGMGEVFLALERGVGGFERPVALKRMCEAKTGAPLSPGIAHRLERARPRTVTPSG